jgi:threonine 3-dehydrogenase
VRAGGWISLLGLSNRPATLNVSDDIVMKGLTLHGVIGRRLPESWQKADAYIRSGSIDLAALITHRFPLEGIDEAMQLMKSGECGKVALTV